MGGLLSCCDGSEANREETNDEKVRKLFELIDLNDDGLITVDEFVLTGLNQIKAHPEMRISSEEEQRIRDACVQRFYQIGSSFKPISHEQYKEWILQSVTNMEPRDFEAQVRGPKRKHIFHETLLHLEHPRISTIKHDQILSTLTCSCGLYFFQHLFGLLTSF